MKNKKILAMCMATASLFALSSLSFADDIHHDTEYGEHIINDEGEVTINGNDPYNEFHLRVIGHTNAMETTTTPHTQITTGLLQSRLTVMAGEADDVAPRLGLIGAEDDVPHLQGLAIIDYGSNKKDLDDAQFRVRYNDTNGATEVMRIDRDGNQTVGGGVQMNTNTALVQPDCDSSTRGTLWVTQGNTDVVEICASKAGTLGWYAVSF